MTHSTHTATGTKQLTATSVSPLEQSGSNKNDIQKYTIKEAVPVSDFRNAIDYLFDLVNIHYHACVGKQELNDFFVRLKRNHAKLSGLTCKRAKPYDIEQFQRALAAAEACLFKAGARLIEAQQITEEDFIHLAKVAANSDCLRKRDGEFGVDLGIFLNGHLMMKSEVNEEGEREYFKYY